jgi:glycine cleavage system T protein
LRRVRVGRVVVGMSELKRTPLRDFHAARGARLVDFAGWEMPVQYRSILEEHRAVRRAAGLFDVSHMGEVDVRGPDAAKFLDRLVTNDVSKLFPGRILYSPMCYTNGGVVDDLLVYQKAPDEYFICVNASNVAKDVAWMQEQAAGLDVTISDRSDDYGLLAIQGPRAAEIVQSLTGAKLGVVKYYHFTEGTVAGVHCLISRTGYTGEDGFELYHAAGDSVALAEALLAAGAAQGLELAGLGARDSLRLEAGYPLYGHELSADISPIAAGLGWTVKFDKASDFNGRAALLAEKQNPGQKVVFFKTGDRRIVRADAPVLDEGGATVGRVLSGTLSPVLNEAIGSALVPSAAVGTPLSVDIRGARLGLQVVKPPFLPLGAK